MHCPKVTKSAFGIPPLSVRTGRVSRPPVKSFVKTGGGGKPDHLGDALKWEPARGGALFPHLYRNLRMTDVLWNKALPLGASGHIFPEGHMFAGGTP